LSSYPIESRRLAVIQPKRRTKGFWKRLFSSCCPCFSRSKTRVPEEEEYRYKVIEERVYETPGEQVLEEPPSNSVEETAPTVSVRVKSAPITIEVIAEVYPNPEEDSQTESTSVAVVSPVEADSVQEKPTSLAVVSTVEGGGPENDTTSVSEESPDKCIDSLAESQQIDGSSEKPSIDLEQIYESIHSETIDIEDEIDVEFVSIAPKNPIIKRFLLRERGLKKKRKLVIPLTRGEVDLKMTRKERKIIYLEDTFDAKQTKGEVRYYRKRAQRLPLFRTSLDFFSDFKDRNHNQRLQPQEGRDDSKRIVVHKSIALMGGGPKRPDNKDIDWKAIGFQSGFTVQPLNYWLGLKYFSVALDSPAKEILKRMATTLVKRAQSSGVGPTVAKEKQEKQQMAATLVDRVQSLGIGPTVAKNRPKQDPVAKEPQKIEEMVLIDTNRLRSATLKGMGRQLLDKSLPVFRSEAQKTGVNSVANKMEIKNREKQTIRSAQQMGNKK
jgi:hypothetical protein